MEYLKHKTLSTFIWVAFFAWPFLHQTLSVPNHAILSFILYMADFVTFLNKNRKMVYSEYKLIKGADPQFLKTHLWLISILICRVIGQTTAWTAISAIHIFSPLYGFTLHGRLILLYTSMLFDILADGIYRRCYKKWVVHYDPVPLTNDTEILPGPGRKAIN
jgi:hypothetical protein